MLKISPLDDCSAEKFCALYREYRAENGNKIIEAAIAGSVTADVIYDGETAVGFAVCAREISDGAGEVKDIFVAPPFRLRGLGKFLLLTEEFRLAERGADRFVCLPAEGTEGFFAACGYSPEREPFRFGNLSPEETASEQGRARIYVKRAASTCSCGGDC